MTTRTDSGSLWGLGPVALIRTAYGMRRAQKKGPKPLCCKSSKSGIRLVVAQAHVQLTQLLVIDRARRMREQVLRALGLGEGDHVADRIGLGHQRHQAIQAEGQAAMRRGAVLERVEQEAELGLRFVGPGL